MTTMEVLAWFKAKKPELEVTRIYCPQEGVHIVIAPEKGKFITASPTSYLVNDEEETIMLYNPVNNLKGWREWTDKANLVYDKTKR